MPNPVVVGVILNWSNTQLGSFLPLHNDSTHHFNNASYYSFPHQIQSVLMKLITWNFATWYHNTVPTDETKSIIFYHLIGLIYIFWVQRGHKGSCHSKLIRNTKQQTSRRLVLMSATFTINLIGFVFGYVSGNVNMSTCIVKSFLVNGS